MSMALGHYWGAMIQKAKNIRRVWSRSSFAHARKGVDRELVYHVSTEVRRTLPENAASDQEGFRKGLLQVDLACREGGMVVGLVT